MTRALALLMLAGLLVACGSGRSFEGGRDRTDYGALAHGVAKAQGR